MGNIPKKIQTWQMIAPQGKDKETGKIIEGKFEKTGIPVPELREGEVLVEVAGQRTAFLTMGGRYLR